MSGGHTRVFTAAEVIGDGCDRAKNTSLTFYALYKRKYAVQIRYMPCVTIHACFKRERNPLANQYSCVKAKRCATYTFWDQFFKTQTSRRTRRAAVSCLQGADLHGAAHTLLLTAPDQTFSA